MQTTYFTTAPESLDMDCTVNHGVVGRYRGSDLREVQLPAEKWEEQKGWYESHAYTTLTEQEADRIMEGK